MRLLTWDVGDFLDERFVSRNVATKPSYNLWAQFHHLFQSSPSLSVSTWVVPAASSGAASPPLAPEERRAPLLHPAVLQGVRRQVADLQTGELPQEVSEGHPGRQK